MGDRKAGAANVHADRDQVEDITSKAKQMGVPLRVLEPELDVSGGLPLNQRPSLLTAVEGVERGEFAGILVSYLSRLGRNTREQLLAWDRVEAAGGRIVVVRDHIDTSTPSGRLQRTMMLAIAEHDLDQHKERFENLRAWATAAGIWQRRQTPRGYRRDPETRRLVPDPRADEVRRAFEARGQRGETITAIAKTLRMTPGGARGLLRNRVYLGELRVGPYVNTDAHQPLIIEEQWIAAQAARITREPRAYAQPALLAGLVRCCGCGHVMSRRATGSRHAYSCARFHSAGECPEPAVITMTRLDEYVSDLAVRLLSRLDIHATTDRTDVDDAKTKLADARRELAAYLEGVQAAGLDPADFANGARQRQQAVSEAQSELGSLLSHRPTPVDRDPIAAWNRADVRQRNQLLRSFSETVLVKQVGRGRSVPVDHRVRVVATGAGIAPPVYRGGGAAMPISQIALPHRDDERVLRVLEG
jgi:DNA invertase Pin-like site-specific DNA recombinase